MDDLTIALRASRSVSWARCQRRARHEEEHPEPEGRVIGKPVSREFGDQLHKALTGHEIVQPAASIIYDHHTRTFKEMQRQLQSAALTANLLLQAKCLNVVEREAFLEMPASVSVGGSRVVVEVSGHIDLRTEPYAGPYEGKSVILDLKSGVYEPNVYWPQMAVYTLLVSVKRPGTVARAGILWVSRNGKNSKLETRPAKELIREAKNIVRKRALAAVYGESASPSQEWCATCDVANCGLRAVERKAV